MVEDVYTHMGTSVQRYICKAFHTHTREYIAPAHMPVHTYLYAHPYTHTPLHAYMHMLVCYTTQHSHMCTYLHSYLHTHTPLHISVQHLHMFTHLHAFLCTLMYTSTVFVCGQAVPWGPTASLGGALNMAYLGEAFMDGRVDIRISGTSQSWELPTT